MPQSTPQRLDPWPVERRSIVILGESGAQRAGRLEGYTHRLHAVVSPDLDDEPRNRRMDVHVLVRIHVIEPQTGRTKRLELRLDLHRELTSNSRHKEKPDTGAGHVSVEFAISVDELRDFGPWQNRPPVDEDEMQTDAQRRKASRAFHRIGGRQARDHQARTR